MYPFWYTHYCDYSVVECLPRLLKSYYQKVHIGREPVSCDVCNKSVADKPALKKHLKFVMAKFRFGVSDLAIHRYHYRYQGNVIIFACWSHR